MKDAIKLEIASLLKGIAEKEESNVTRSFSPYAILDRIHKCLMEDLKECGVKECSRESVVIAVRDNSHIFGVYLYDADGRSYYIGDWDDYKEKMDYIEPRMEG